MVKERMPKFTTAYCRSWKRRRMFTLLLCVFGMTQVAFVIMWHYRAPIAKRSALMRHVNGNRIEHSVAARIQLVLTEFKGPTAELSSKLKTGFGGHIMIEYSDGNGVRNDVTFKYAKASFPKRIEFLKLDTKNRAEQKSAYVRVYAKYWEQMTMNLRALISLAGQAKLGGRKLLQPAVENSGFGRDGHSLGIYFDVGHFNSILTSSDYTTLVDQNEYNRECLKTDANHVTIHFLYTQKGVDWTKSKLKLDDKEYNDMSARASKSGWTECKSLSNLIKDTPNAKQYCVEPSKIQEWEKLEKDVIKGAKCLTISIWRGIGGGFRTHFKDNKFKVKSRDVQFALKPAGNIIKEAQIFTNRVIRGRYIAVQVRGERVVIPHNLERLRACLRLLTEVISILKKQSNITQVLIASDMSNFGSGSWKGSLKGEVYDDNTLKDLHSFLISSTGGVEYKPSAENVDRGVVALVEMTLIAGAQHLITIGTGSFQEWIRAKFLEQHRGHDRPNWSLITMCSK